ncbi:hypothetical protein [Dyella sp. C11]|uniref:hypothetical protein n=1 Tax=Dyella sp. C11 TaxID=2126991 RepID=UPI000D65D6D7|nr:hypothetical protein [Dyella sp. C11]
MNWDVLPADPEQLRLARCFVDAVPACGVSRRALAQASREAFSDPARWTAFFPDGPTGMIWFISDVSDASMHAIYAMEPAQCIADVIGERFAQNAELKPFVRRVMQYDVLHPFQALARMQRTAKVMYACRARIERPGFIRLALLNIFYTALVLFWLYDRSPHDTRTKAATDALMRLLRT